MISPDDIHNALFWRILDDPVYTKKRLRRVPTDADVHEAIPRAVSVDEVQNAIAELLDRYESDVWSELGADP